APAPSISTAPIHVTADRNGSIIKPPAVFKGDEKTNDKNAQEARTFLTRFINWAEHQQNLHRGDLDGIYYRKDGNWIASFLSFMEGTAGAWARSEEHTSELQSHRDLVCRLLLERRNHPVASSGKAGPAPASCVGRMNFDWE